MRKERLQSLMLAAHLSATALSELIGVSDRQIRRWLSGASEPNSDKLMDIAQALNTSTDYLLGNTDEQFPTTKVETLNIKEWQILSALRRGDSHAALRVTINSYD